MPIGARWQPAWHNRSDLFNNHISIGFAQTQVKVQMGIRSQDCMAAQVRQELRQPAWPLGKVKTADDVDQFGE